jgi:hypothetical protein
VAKGHPNQNAQNTHINQDDNAIAGQLNGDDFIAAGAIDLFAVGPHGPWWGNGNANANYNITNDDKDQIQTALKIHQRSGPDVTPTGQAGTGVNGEQFYNAPAGQQSATRANFNFDYEVNTAHGADNIDAAKTLANYDFKMEISQFLGGSTTASHTAIFDLNPVTHVWTDEANPLAWFGGDDFSGQAGASASVMARVAENSVNLGFAGLQSDFGPLATSTAAGTVYDIKAGVVQRRQHADVHPRSHHAGGADARVATATIRRRRAP